MTENEKAHLQARHRLEEAQARDRVKERKARTRQLIQKGAILEKAITRGEGRTACGAAAYMSCSRIHNDYDGIQHGYIRKGGLVWERIFLPVMASTDAP